LNLWVSFYTRSSIVHLPYKSQQTYHMRTFENVDTPAERHKQPDSDQPRFRCTSWGRGGLPLRSGGPRGRAPLKRCTATAYAGFSGAQVQRSCTFAPGNPGFGPRSPQTEHHTMMPAAGGKIDTAGAKSTRQTDGNGRGKQHPARFGELGVST